MAPGARRSGGRAERRQSAEGGRRRASWPGSRGWSWRRIPTRGLDLRAAEAIHARLRAAAAGGAAVLVYSSDLDEVLALADRVLVAARGVADRGAGRRDAGARSAS